MKTSQLTFRHMEACTHLKQLSQLHKWEMKWSPPNMAQSWVPIKPQPNSQAIDKQITNQLNPQRTLVPNWASQIS